MYAKHIEKPGIVRLADYATDDDGGMKRPEGEEKLNKLGEELGELQELLYAASQNALLIVLQGRDTSGKDGATNAVDRFMDVVGVSVASFKEPTKTDLAHDFLWRIHALVPPLGHVTFFNRSHYEDVLVTRVRNLVPKDVWRGRYDHINHFESLLADAGVILVKFYLHISKDEQEKRLLAREHRPEKAWKMAASDWVDRALWDDYTHAYEDVLGKCVAPHAPWYIVPADRKWYRNVAVAEVLVKALRPYRAGWMARLEKMSETQRAEMRAMRAAAAASKSA